MRLVKSSKNEQFCFLFTCYKCVTSFMHIGEGGATRSCGAKRIFAIIAILRVAKTFTWPPTATIDNKTNWHKKMGNMAFLDSEIIIVIDLLHV